MEIVSIDKMSKLRESDSVSDVDPIRKSIKYGTTFQAARGIIFEYFNESSIHGFKYISDPKRSTIDRIIWLCALVISIVVCSFLIAIIWEKSTNNPVILAFDEKPIPVWEIPFPSVTICPETKSHASIFNYTQLLRKAEDSFYNYTMTSKEQYFYEAISQTCLNHIEVYDSISKPIVSEENLIQALWEAAPRLEETFVFCFWKDSGYDCADNFTYVLTEDGICFSFNSPRIENRGDLYTSLDENPDKPFEWNLEDGYNKQAGENAFPYRSFGAAHGEGLTVILRDKKEDEDQFCRDNDQGFKVILHTPGEEPHVSKNFINIPFEKSVSLSIKPKIIKTSEGLRGYQAKRRKCYYEGEVNLKYFKTYTQGNCELECLTNETLAECECVKFSMPRDSNHPICGKSKNACLKMVRKNIRMNINKNILESNANKSGTQVNACYNNYCLPTCYSIDYKVELKHQFKYDYIKESRVYSSIWFTPGERLTQVKINFKGDVFTGLRRSEMYTTTDFIASFGGLLGLFMGVSILSLVELVYFFTIRLWMNLQARRRKKLQSNELKANEQSKRKE